MEKKTHVSATKQEHLFSIIAVVIRSRMFPDRRARLQSSVSPFGAMKQTARCWVQEERGVFSWGSTADWPTHPGSALLLYI